MGSNLVVVLGGRRMGDGLAVIGAAFPRTGTMSVKRALERLGVGRCYHMHEVYANPGHAEIWRAAAAGTLPDWSELFRGYTCTLDTPACHFWRELMERFPKAKVLLLRRDPESWYDSVHSTIYRLAQARGGDADPGLSLSREVLFGKYMQNRFEDRAYAVGVYREYCDDVRRTVPPDRLLEYSVTEGWQPLCGLRGCPVPAEPFPRANTRAMFAARNSGG